MNLLFINFLGEPYTKFNPPNTKEFLSNIHFFHSHKPQPNLEYHHT